MASDDTEKARIDQVVRKLHGFAKLHAGWSFGRGLPISSDALAIAEDYLRLALQLQLTADVFPGLDGECAVRFYRGKDTVQVTINPDSTLDLRCERNDDDLIDPVVNAKSQDVYKHLLDCKVSLDCIIGLSWQGCPRNVWPIPEVCAELSPYDRTWGDR